MNKLINYLLGSARVEISGLFPERVVNLCAQNDVVFWAVEWPEDGKVILSIREYGLPALGKFAEKSDCDITIQWRRGIPQFLSRFKQRYGFLIGLGVSLLAVAVLSGFIFTIDIVGNDRVSDQVILQQLYRRGIRPGAYGPALDRRQIEQEIMLELKDLAWMTINLHGTRVEVQVLETKTAPVRVDEDGFFHITAKADGIITGIQPEQGDALVKKGDTVGKGDILISGTVTMEPPKYSDLPVRYYQTHARGRVWARTWRQVTAVMPEQTLMKCPAERERIGFAVIFFGNRVEFFGNSSISDVSCDKITRVRQIELPGGSILPVWILEERRREYTLQPVTVAHDAAADLMRDALHSYFKTIVGENGEVLRVEYETRIADGLIQVTATGECLEEIGQELCAE